MYLIAGLGNPDAKYADTRHNTGFHVALYLHDQMKFPPEREKFQALVSKGTIGGTDVIIVLPFTYMNSSGIAVRQAADFYKIGPDHILIIYDDIDLDVGAIRIRKNGSAGGHNGMKSIIQYLGTDRFPRIRVGVGAKPEGWDLADHVLSGFSREEAALMDKAVETAAKAAECIVTDGIDKAMNLYNTKHRK